MNYGISILFRAIPLAMAVFCFGYGAFIYGYGDAGNRLVAGPVVFSLGMICIALFCTAATIIRQIIHTYNEATKYVLPVVGYLAAIITIIGGICIFNSAYHYFSLRRRACHNRCRIYHSLCSYRRYLFHPIFFDSGQCQSYRK